MKKLVIAAFAVAFAAVAQAGSVKWTVSNVYAGNETDLASGCIYMFITSTVAADQVVAAIQKAYASGGSAGVTTYLNANALGSGGTAYGLDSTTAGNFSLGTAVANADLGLAGQTTYTFYGVVFNDKMDSIDKDTKMYVTTAKGATTKADTATQTLTVGIGTQADKGSKLASKWTAVGAPEPSSALLMLLGLGAMALRRRRA